MIVPTRWLTMAVLLLGGSATACFWSYGFQGGGLPKEIKTVAILPFENETASPELPRELTEALREGFEKRLGLRPASEEKANAIARGKIVRYDLDIAVGVSADRQQSTSARRRLAIAIDIELVNQLTGKVLWQKSGVVGEGDYAERGETSGRKVAIDRIVAEIIEGAQSQW